MLPGAAGYRRKDGTPQPKKETASASLFILTAMLLPRRQPAAHTCGYKLMEYLHLDLPISI